MEHEQCAFLSISLIFNSMHTEERAHFLILKFHNETLIPEKKKQFENMEMEKWKHRENLYHAN